MQVLRVLVVGAETHEDADVVQQRGHLEQEAVAHVEAVLVPQFVEQPRGEAGDVPRVPASYRYLLAERLGAGQHLLAEVREAVGQPSAREARPCRPAGRPAATRAAP